MSKQKAILNIGLTFEELSDVVNPIRDDNGDIPHSKKFVFDELRMRSIIGERKDFDKLLKRKIHFITKKSIESLNDMGVNQYIPDKFKSLIPILLAMNIMIDSEFIKILEDR